MADEMREAKTLSIQLEDGTGATIIFHPGDDINAALAELGISVPDDPVWTTQEAAEQQVINIPNWAAWTEEQALEWHDANIGTPLEAVPDVGSLTPTAFQNNAQAIVDAMISVMRQMETEQRAVVRLLIAVRNRLWPNLQQ